MGPRPEGLTAVTNRLPMIIQGVLPIVAIGATLTLAVLRVIDGATAIAVIVAAAGIGSAGATATTVTQQQPQGLSIPPDRPVRVTTGGPRDRV